MALRDTFGRRLDYLRLSITDRCNFRCVYCLPEGCTARGASAPLAPAELERLVRGFAALGFWKVRLTGGEPTLRGDLVEIVERVAAVPGITRVGLTTNGHRLARLAPALRAAGLAAVNVSLDSLDPDRFQRITGASRLDEVLEGLEAAAAAGLPSVKVNAVLLDGLDGEELDRFLDLARRLPVTVRFIELMRTGSNGALYERARLPAGEVAARLLERGWRPLPQVREHGVAVQYAHPDLPGQVGIIAASREGFCARCNRLRVSSTGDLETCLFGGGGTTPLRPHLAPGAGRRELLRAIRAAVSTKPAGHRLREGLTGTTSTLATLGG
jgi:cyclic pyranopterin phosphate synthase